MRRYRKRYNMYMYIFYKYPARARTRDPATRAQHIADRTATGLIGVKRSHNRTTRVGFAPSRRRRFSDELDVCLHHASWHGWASPWPLRFRFAQHSATASPAVHAVSAFQTQNHKHVPGYTAARTGHGPARHLWPAPACAVRAYGPGKARPHNSASDPSSS